MKLRKKEIKIINRFCYILLALLVLLPYSGLTLLLFLLIIIILIYINFIVEPYYDNTKNNEINLYLRKINLSPIYQLKPFMTNTEYKFYEKLKVLEDNYKIIPQLNLASIIKKKSNNRYINELFKNIDYAVFSKDYKKLLLLIELNDESHNNKKRVLRDLKVKRICKAANIKLITFYTKYSNEKEYVISRILKEIDDSTSINSELNNKDELK